MIVLISSAEREKVDFIAKWLAGNICGTDWPFISALLPWLIILIPYTLYKANRLNLLGLNEPVAIGVGLSIEKGYVLFPDLEWDDELETDRTIQFIMHGLGKKE